MNSTGAFHKLLSEFPCMVPNDSSLSAYSGFVCIKGREFRVCITSDCSRFDADESLKTMLGTKSVGMLKDRLQAATDPHEFLIELRDLVERAMRKDSNNQQESGTDLPPSFYYERLLSEISEIGWNRIGSMDQAMRSLDLIVKDSANRSHTINLRLPVNYPSHVPLCAVSLPIDFEVQWNEGYSLQSVISQFEELIESLQDFFRAMEDLDKNTWILEPEYPTWRETYRRIALGKHCSARIEVDPRAPIKGFPECRFLGSENAIGPFKQQLNQNIHNWDTSGTVLPRSNLEIILEMTLPTRDVNEDGEDGDLAVECGICYSYRLDDQVPDVACDLKECSKPYHRHCLTGWLQALPDTRESFGTLSGNCVYCEHPISVSIKNG